MAYQYADYSSRSERLIQAGEQLIQSLQDDSIDRSIAIQDLESAARATTASELTLRFAAAGSSAGARTAEPISPEDALSGVLLDVQAANVLLSAGVALNEHGRGSTRQFLDNSMSEIQNSGAIVTQNLAAQARLRFSPASGIKSSSVEEAKKVFSENADAALKDIVSEAAMVVGDMLKNLKKFGGAKVGEGIQKIGESSEFLAAAGRLIQRGLDILKNALEALSKLFGKEALASAKTKVGEIWDKFQAGQYTQNLLARLFDLKATQSHIVTTLAQADLEIEAIDTATNALSALAEKYKGNMKLLRSLMSAVALAGTIITFLQLAAPWIPLALAIVYAALIAATILVGMDYSDSGRVLRWVRGVGEIASGIRPPAKP
jgi:hypothetical protein